MNDTVRNENVIAALRLAAEAHGDDHERFGRIAKVILNEAPETVAENRGGVEMLLSLHRAGALKLELDVNG